MTRSRASWSATMPAAIRSVRRAVDRVGTGGAGQATGREMSRSWAAYAGSSPSVAQRAEHPVSHLVRGERRGRSAGHRARARVPSRGPARWRPSQPSELVEIDQHAAYAGVAQQLDRRVGRAAVHQHRAPGRADRPADQGLALTSAVDRTMPEKPLAVGTAPASTLGQQRLVELDERARSRAAVGASRRSARRSPRPATDQDRGGRR